MRVVGDVAALAVLQRDDDLLARPRTPTVQAVVGVLDPQPLVAADEVRWSLRISAPGSRCDSQSTWKPLQMPSTGRPPLARVDHRLHHRREAGDGAAAQVVAVGEAAGQDHRVDAVQVVVAVPERDRLAAGEADRARGVAVVERAREGDDADPHAAHGRSSTRHGEVLDHRVGEQRLGGISRIWASARLVDRRRRPRARSACPAGRRRCRRSRGGAGAWCTAWPCGSRISGLSMTSTTTRAIRALRRLRAGVCGGTPQPTDRPAGRPTRARTVRT